MSSNCTCVFACKIYAPVLKDCCSKCYKILAGNSTRFLFGALQSKIFCVSIENTSVKSLHWPSFMPVSSVCPPCSATLLQCFTHLWWVKQEQCHKWLKPLALCKVFWNSKLHQIYPFTGNDARLSQYIKVMFIFFILLLVFK